MGWAQLQGLREADVYNLLALFNDVLDPDEDKQIRYLVSDFGSGKTTALKDLRAKKIPGASYLINVFPLNEQKEVLAGNVIFVDEAAARTNDELKQIKETVEKNDGVAIMLVPNQEVKKAVEDRINT